MTSTDAIITSHIDRAREHIDHARQQLAQATTADRPTWQIQLQADERTLIVLLELQDQVRAGADPLDLSEHRREQLRLAAEAADPDHTHNSHIVGAAGGIAQHAIATRALAPFTAMATLHSALRQASRAA